MSAIYWNEQCFDLTPETLVDKAMELKAVGGTYGGNNKATPFLCLILKMLQLNPARDIVLEFINNVDFKYMRCLGAFYLRLTGASVDVYKYLEPVYADYRKIRYFNKEGRCEIIHVDDFIDLIFQEERACDIILPRLVLRLVFEEAGELGKRVSFLEEELQKLESESTPPRKRRSRSRSKDKHKKRDKRRSRSKDKNKKRHRSGSREKRKSSRGRKMNSLTKRKREEQTEQTEEDVKELDNEKMNTLRASLGLKPLQQ